MATKKNESVAEEKTIADKIWDKIQNVPLDIYALPAQTIKDHVVREKKLEKAVPDALHLILKSAAVLPAMDEALRTAEVNRRLSWGSDERGPLTFEISQSGKYTVLKVVPRDL